MPEPKKRTTWQRFCAAMVRHGHGRSADIAVLSADRPLRNAREAKELERRTDAPVQRSARPVPAFKPAGLHLR